MSTPFLIFFQKSSSPAFSFTFFFSVCPARLPFRDKRRFTFCFHMCGRV
jgi:hypothetical protein